jgi:aconitate hydratase
VIAKSYARIGWQNLANFGILPLEFVDPKDYDAIERDDLIAFDDLRLAIASGVPIVAQNQTKKSEVRLIHRLSERQVRAVLAGGLINQFKHEHLLEGADRIQLKR